MTRGFTLVELLVGVAIGSFAVLVSAFVARAVTVGAEESRLRLDLGRDLPIAQRQLAADLEVVGLATGGAVAVDRTVAPWNTIAVRTPTGGGDAIAAVRGVDDAPAIPVGGTRIRTGSDVVQLVVPNPGRRTRTVNTALAGSSVFELDDFARLAGCPAIYVADHSVGVARAQILFVRVHASALQTVGAAQFDVAANSEILCARVSTYWVDAEGWMRRTDLGAGGALIGVGPGVVIDADAADGTDRIAPAIGDLQIAYRVSSELFTNNAQAAPTAPTLRWAFSGAAPVASAALTGTSVAAQIGWFEVREVRFGLLGRQTRSPKESATRDVPSSENGPARAGRRTLSYRWTTSAADLPNLRFFDQRMPAGVAAEPY